MHPGSPVEDVPPEAPAMPEVPAVEGSHQSASRILPVAPMPAGSDTSVEEVELHRGASVEELHSPAVATLDAMVSGGLNRVQESTYDMLRSLNTPPPGSQQHAVQEFQHIVDVHELASHEERRERAALAVSKLRELAGEDVLADLKVSSSKGSKSSADGARRGSTTVAL